MRRRSLLMIPPPEIIFGYDSVRKVNDDVSCWIEEV